jgi:iron-sulfur cluster assembly protein
VEVLLMLTEEAAEVIRGLAEAPGAAGLRISPTPPVEGPGPAFEAEIAPAADAQDDVVEAGGALIFLAPGAADALEDKVLHAEAKEGEVRFRVLEQS